VALHRAPAQARALLDASETCTPLRAVRKLLLHTQLPGIDRQAASTSLLAVLRMLPLRLSNREMAAQIYISVNTLKTHLRSIYRKLGVPHRSEAVRRAKAAQLV